LKGTPGTGKGKDALERRSVPRRRISIENRHLSQKETAIENREKALLQKVPTQREHNGHRMIEDRSRSSSRSPGSRRRRRRPLSSVPWSFGQEGCRSADPKLRRRPSVRGQDVPEVIAFAFAYAGDYVAEIRIKWSIFPTTR
jgi:hypothetical protein